MEIAVSDATEIKALIEQQKTLLEAHIKTTNERATADAEFRGAIRTTLQNMETRATVAREETREELRGVKHRLDDIEKRVPRAEESARKALQSSSDLVAENKVFTKATTEGVQILSSRLGKLSERVDSMDKEQTPILQAIRKEQVERAAREAERSEVRARDEARHKRTIAYLAVVGPIVIALLGLLGSYLGTRAAHGAEPPTEQHASH